MKHIEVLTQTILPKSLHGINPRTIMGQAKWDKIKKAKLLEADHHCMACDEYVPHVAGNYLECHEVYTIDLEKKEFQLADIVCLCKRCHEYIHRARLKRLVAEGVITQEYYDSVIERGNALLHANNLVKNDLPKNEINNPDWYLLYEGKKYSNNL